MAIGMIVDMLGVTQDQYDQVRREVMPNNQAPTGLLHHAAGPTTHGWLVCEVWESREALDRFFADRYSGALQRATISIQPQFYEVVCMIQP